MSQTETEKAVFLEFVPASGLPIDLKTVENRLPPEPDIVCSIDGRGLVGFELTELIDAEFMERASIMGQMNTHLSEARREALTNSQMEGFNQAFSNALLHFSYRSDANLRQMQRVTKNALLLLMQLPQGFEGIALYREKYLEPLLQVSVRRGVFSGPVLDVASSGWLGDPTAQAIRKKLSKTYDCDYPLELLAYIRIDLLPPDDAWMSAAEEAAQGLPESQFERIWVFDISDGQIRYVVDR